MAGRLLKNNRGRKATGVWSLGDGRCRTAVGERLLENDCCRSAARARPSAAAGRQPLFYGLSMLENDRHRTTPRGRRPEDSRKRTAATGQLLKHSHDRTATGGLPWWDGRYRTAAVARPLFCSRSRAAAVLPLLEYRQPLENNN